MIFNLPRPSKRWDFDFGTQCGLSVTNRHLQNQVLAIAVKQFVSLNFDENVAVAGWTAASARFAFAANPNSHPVVHTSGDRNF